MFPRFPQDNGDTLLLDQILPVARERLHLYGALAADDAFLADDHESTVNRLGIVEQELDRLWERRRHARARRLRESPLQMEVPMFRLTREDRDTLLHIRPAC